MWPCNWSTWPCWTIVNLRISVVLIDMFVEASRHIQFLNPTLAFVGQMYWQIAKWSILGVEFRCCTKVPHHVFFAKSCCRRLVNSCRECDHAVYVNVVHWNVCGFMSVDVFLHLNPVLVSLSGGYEVCKLNFLIRYVKFHSLSKYALEIMSDQTRRSWKNV